MTTRTRRRGPTCHRSVRRGHGVPRAAAIRRVPDVRLSAGARAVPADLGLPLAQAPQAPLAALLAAQWVLVALAAVLAVSAPLAALVAARRVLAVTAAALKVLAAMAA